MISSHFDIELSFYRFISENIENVYSYTINYDDSEFDVDAHDSWVSIKLLELGAGVKKSSQFRVDIIIRKTVKEYRILESRMVDVLRSAFTNVAIPMYDFSGSSIVAIPYEKLIILNTEGLRTVESVVTGNIQDEDLKRNLRRSSVYLRLMLLTDTTGGRVI